MEPITLNHSFVIPTFFLFCVYVVTAIRWDAFSTKTAYEWAHPRTDAATNSLYNTQYKNGACSAIHVSGVVRHGARYPSDGDIEDMDSLQEKFKHNVTNEEFAFLRNYRNPFVIEDDKRISDLGRYEQRTLGKWYGIKLQSLYENNLGHLRFVSSSKERSIQSAVYFYRGLHEAILNETNARNILPAINDDILRYYKECPKYLTSVDDNDNAFMEYTNFRDGTEMTQLKERLNQRLGLIGEELNDDDVDLIYEYCAMETQIVGNSSWCKLFSDEDQQYIEYAADLEKYWGQGYGYKIIRDMTCPLMKNLFGLMDEVISNHQKGFNFTVGSFQFGHSETLTPIYAALGLFKDDVPLMANNYAQQQNRRFKSSAILPFSAHIVFLMHHCPDQAPGNSYVLRLYVNEKPEVIPACNSDVCPYEEVKNYYRKYITECNFELSCKDDVSRASVLKSGLHLLVLLMIVYCKLLL